VNERRLLLGRMMDECIKVEAQERKERKCSSVIDKSMFRKFYDGYYFGKNLCFKLFTAFL
jgi:hypothetical protein